MKGLSQQQAELLLERIGPNRIDSIRKHAVAHLLLRQFTSPTILVLLVSAVIYGALGNLHDALLIFAIIIPSGMLTFAQEFRAEATMRKLTELLKVQVKVIRDEKLMEIPSHEIVPGDLVQLSPGDLVAADLEIIQSENLSIDESVLSGEILPKNKSAELDNTLFAGSYVASGSCIAKVIRTGKQTTFGSMISESEQIDTETTFEKGAKQFGLLVARAIGILVVFVFIGNLVLDRPAISSLLFSLALAVGLTPQMLPVIISVCLSAGARHLSRKKVLIRRLDVIEDLGTLEVLCADKTGTITTGKLTFAGAIDASGKESARVKKLAYENAISQESSANLIDLAIKMSSHESIQRSKIKEFDFTFERRCVSVLFDDGELVTKGAIHEVLDKCASVRLDEKLEDIEYLKDDLSDQHESLSNQGYKVLGIASGYTDEEKNLIFEGFILIEDPIKPDARSSLDFLDDLGVQLVIITGDSKTSLLHTANQLNFNNQKCITGTELDGLSDEELHTHLIDCRLFAEISPRQKARIVESIGKSGRGVGFIGDGLNDVPALKRADVSISVDSAVDIAKNTSSVVLLEKDLSVIADGIQTGRRTFENTMKYVRITISASFGNVVSMAIASFFLPFLPMLPTQILLLNFFSDFPSLAISYDKVDEEDLAKPSTWRMSDVGHFMIIFGLISTAFDLLLFFAALSLLNGDESAIRSAWFATSLLTEIFAIIVLRTKKRSWISKPGKLLVWLCAIVTICAVLVPLVGVLEFAGLPKTPFDYLLLIGFVSIGYAITLETIKLKVFKN